MIKTVGFNLFIKKLVQSSANFGLSVCFLICVCGTVKTATLLSRVMGKRTCSRACHAAVFSPPPPGVKSCKDVFEWCTSTGSKAFNSFTKFVLLSVLTLSLYSRFAQNCRQECKKVHFLLACVPQKRRCLNCVLEDVWPAFSPYATLKLPLGLSESGKGTRGTRVFTFPLPRASISFFSSNALQLKITTVRSEISTLTFFQRKRSQFQNRNNFGASSMGPLWWDSKAGVSSVFQQAAKSQISLNQNLP